MTEFLEDQAFGSETVMIDIIGTDERDEKTQFTTEGLLLVLENESALVYHEINTEELPAPCPRCVDRSTSPARR